MRKPALYFAMILLINFLLLMHSTNNVASIDFDKVNEIEIAKYYESYAETRNKLKEIWVEIFNISINDNDTNFFTIGGDSLKLLLLKEKIKDKFDVDLQA